MTGSRKQLFISSTRSHARRYDIPIAMPAFVIDPLSLIASKSRILPGPIARSPPRSTRRVSRAVATSEAPIPPRSGSPIETGIQAFVKSTRIFPLLCGEDGDPLLVAGSSSPGRLIVLDACHRGDKAPFSVYEDADILRCRSPAPDHPEPEKTGR